MLQSINNCSPLGRAVLCTLAASLLAVTQSFVLVPMNKLVREPLVTKLSNSRRGRFNQNRLSNTRLFALPDITSMKPGDMRKELESYGISTKSFFEKREFADALGKARADGLKTKKASASSSGNSGKSSPGKSRADRMKEEMEKANKMKLGDLKMELKAMGISTKSFFEKFEFVKAYAEARVNGAGKKGTVADDDEPFDPSYRDVVVQKCKPDPRDPRMQGPLIDVKLGK